MLKAVGRMRKSEPYVTGARVDFRQNGEQEPDSLEGCNSHINFAEENWLPHTVATTV